MADNTRIEWADATLNYVNGCTRKSPGCMNCYAELLAATRLRNVPSRAGLAEMTPGGPRWTGKINIDDRALDQAIRWRRPRRIFWNAHGDLFHDAVPDEAIDRLFAVCALTPHHTHMILTKRTARMRAYMQQLDDYALHETPEYRTAFYRVDCDDDPNGSGAWHERTGQLEDAISQISETLGQGKPLPNVWLGVSVEDQQRADECREDFAATPAAVKFVSYEPALGPVNWAGWEFVNQIIGGGESGKHARPSHPDWQRATRDFCAPHGIAYFFKQWGEWAPIREMSEELTESIYHPAPEHSPEATRRCKVDVCVLHRDATRFDGRAMYEREAFWQGTGAMTMFAVGKRQAGRLLDGIEHNNFPEVKG